MSWRSRSMSVVRSATISLTRRPVPYAVMRIARCFGACTAASRRSTSVVLRIVGSRPAAIRGEVPRAAQVQPARVLAQATQTKIGIHPVTQLSHVALLLLDARDWAEKEGARRWDRLLVATGSIRRVCGPIGGRAAGPCCREAA